jgi:Holliday junction resolvase RusA-like endonuclease
MRVDRLWIGNDGALRGVVHGALPSKANSRKVATVGPKHARRTLFIKSQEARDYDDQFRVAVQSSNLGNALPFDAAALEIDVTVYQDSLRRDLDIELLCDCLQRSGVITNDRKFWRKVSERKIDKQNPRVEFFIRKRKGLA